jgi:lambda repressor-like predicted transcriptional regulator
MNEPPLADNEPLSGDPLAELTRRMQQLRHNSGLSYERMSRKVYRSKTVLYNADKGVRVPDWELLSDYLKAILDDSADAQLAELEPVWRAAQNQRPVPRQRAAIRPGLPSPHDATDPATYVRLLDQLRNSTGHKIRALSERAGLAKSTLNDRFSWKRLWPRDVTERYLRACGLDDASVEAWLAVYDRLNLMPEPLREPPAPPGPPTALVRVTPALVMPLQARPLQVPTAQVAAAHGGAAQVAAAHGAATRVAAAQVAPPQVAAAQVSAAAAVAEAVAAVTPATAAGVDGDPPEDVANARRTRLAWWIAVLVVVTILIAVLKTA